MHENPQRRVTACSSLATPRVPIRESSRPGNVLYDLFSANPKRRSVSLGDKQKDAKPVI